MVLTWILSEPWQIWCCCCCWQTTAWERDTQPRNDLGLSAWKSSQLASQREHLILHVNLEIVERHLGCKAVYKSEAQAVPILSSGPWTSVWLQWSQPLNLYLVHSLTPNSNHLCSLKFSELQWTLVYFSALQWSSAHFSEVQWSSVKFSILQCTSVHFSQF